MSRPRRDEDLLTGILEIKLPEQAKFELYHATFILRNLRFETENKLAFKLQITSGKCPFWCLSKIQFHTGIYITTTDIAIIVDYRFAVILP